MRIKESIGVACLLIGATLAPVLHGQTFTFSTVAGGAQGTNDGIDGVAQFYTPTGVAVDAGGNIYVADQANNAVRKVTPVGTNWVVATIAGGVRGSKDGTNTAAQFSGVSGIAMDSATNLYVADQFNYTIRKISPMGTNWVVSTIAGQAGTPGFRNGTNTGAQFSNPASVAVDSSGNIFVADEFNNAIRKISPVGTNWVVTTVAGGSLGAGDGINTNAQFFYPAGVAVDANDHVYIADQFNNMIRLATPSGSNWVVTTLAGQDNSGNADGLGTNAEFTAPVGVSVDSSGNIYVADLFNNAIRRLTPSGPSWQVTTIGGGVQGNLGGVGTNAEFFLPFGVAADTYGDIFVADSGNNAIRLGVSSTASPMLGNVKVVLTPGNAVTAGAAWQLDGGAIQSSGATLANVLPGAHQLTFVSASGFTTPAWQSIIVTARQTATASANYSAGIPNAGSLQVLLAPDAAVDAGALWQIDGGPWQTNAGIVAGLSIGTHALRFNSLTGWNAPTPQTITITNGQTTLAAAAYGLQTGSVRVTIFPGGIIAAGAKWQLDGGEFQAAGSVLTGVLPGSHTIGFETVLGWTTPGSVPITVNNNETATVGGTYLPQPPRVATVTTSNGAPQLVLNCLSGSICVVQASSNLTTWTPISTNAVPLTGSVVINDARGAGQPWRFYRAVAVPVSYPRVSRLTLGNNAVHVTVNGPIGGSCVVLASTNLINWSPISTNVISSDGTLSVTDPMPGNPVARFYRAMMNY